MPFPCTILIGESLAIAQSSRYLSITNVASSTFIPITFISLEMFCDLNFAFFVNVTAEPLLPFLLEFPCEALFPEEFLPELLSIELFFKLNFSFKALSAFKFKELSSCDTSFKSVFNLLRMLFALAKLSLLFFSILLNSLIKEFASALADNSISRASSFAFSTIFCCFSFCEFTCCSKLFLKVSTCLEFFSIFSFSCSISSFCV